MARSGLPRAVFWPGRRVVSVFDDDPAVLSKFIATDVAREYGDCIAVAEPDGVRAAIAASDCVVLSPGVPLDHALVAYAAAEEKPVIGEIEVAYHFTSARIVGITGTNGKSTTVGVIGDILSAAGIDTIVAGTSALPCATCCASAIRTRWCSKSRASSSIPPTNSRSTSPCC
jgi:UDP-N-acetylmuramoylalanine-D-glutamate ligase